MTDNVSLPVRTRKKGGAIRVVGFITTALGLFLLALTFWRHLSGFYGDTQEMDIATTMLLSFSALLIGMVFMLGGADILETEPDTLFLIAFMVMVLLGIGCITSWYFQEHMFGTLVQ